MPGIFAGTPFDRPPTCARCDQLEELCACPPEQPKPNWLPPEKQRAKVRIDQRKHKRTVTVIWGISPCESDLPALLSELKSACGSGGALKSRENSEEQAIELQGDHLIRVTDKLKQIGYRVR